MRPDRSRSRDVRIQAIRYIRLGAAPAIIFVSAAFYGAYLPLPSMLLYAAGALALLICLAQRDLRGDIADLRHTIVPVVMFVATLAIAALSLTPWGPGGVHPLWDWVGGDGATTLNTSATRLEILRLCGLAAFFCVGCCLGARSERARTAIAALLGAGALYAVVALVALGLRLQPLQLGRLLGGFYSANTAGTLFGVLSILSAAWLIRNWRRRSRERLSERLTALSPLLAMQFLFLGCLLLTASRAAIAATGVALVLLALVEAVQARGRRLWWLLGGAAAIAVLIAIVYMAGNSLFLERYSGIEVAHQKRAVIVAAHWQAFQSAPWMGFGLGSYPEVNNQIMTPDNFEPLAATIVLHNTYLQWLEEAGVLGAAAMFLTIASILGLTAWIAVRRRNNPTLMAGLILASLVVLIHAAFDVSLHVPTFTAFWALLLGLGFALAQAPRRRQGGA